MNYHEARFLLASINYKDLFYLYFLVIFLDCSVTRAPFCLEFLETDHKINFCFLKTLPTQDYSISFNIQKHSK